MSTATEPLVVRTEGSVVRVTFNRPEARNAMAFEMYDRLHELCEQVDRDSGARVLVLRGAGDQAFVSGTDIRQFLEFRTREDVLAYEGRITRVLGRLHAMAKPTVAMVQGDAVGGGLFMALACDLRVARRTHGSVPPWPAPSATARRRWPSSSWRPRWDPCAPGTWSSRPGWWGPPKRTPSGSSTGSIPPTLCPRVWRSWRTSSASWRRRPWRRSRN